MRIIAGQHGGRSLASPSDRSIRPTPDRVRESLFAILGNINGAVVVDAFAGTGACGLEALSRGASHCYLIDPEDEAVKLVRENLGRIDAEERGIVLQGTFEEQILLIDDTPDLWLLDPPFDTTLGIQALKKMRAANCVTDQALAVLEQDKRDEIIEVESFEIVDERTYGRNKLLFYRYEEGQTQPE